MLSHRIASLRKRRGLGQAELARALHISASALGMYEQGRRTPSLETLAAMSALFSVSLDYLITGREFAPTPPQQTQRTPQNCPCSICYWKEYSEKEG